jgi:uncharacterized membrane protein
MRRGTEEQREPTAAPSRTTLVVVLVCVVVLLAGYEMKDCFSGRDLPALPKLCWSDANFLYEERGVDHNAFPYIEVETFEYPVLTGLYLWAIGLPVDNVVDFFQLNALVLGLGAIGIAIGLSRRYGYRALLWAAAPSLAFYAFLNFDVLAVAASLVGFWLWRREKPAGAAVAFAIGACLKLYPGLFLIPLVLQDISARRYKRAVGTTIAGAGTLAALNVPFMVANFEGWKSFLTFYANRPPNGDSVWNFVMDTLGLSITTVNTVSQLLVGIFLIATLYLAHRRFGVTNTYPFLEVCAASVVILLMWSKVHSPQFVLWLLPFFVLLELKIGWWLAYIAVDAWVYLGLYGQLPIVSDLVAADAAIGVCLRAVLLFALFAATVRRIQKGPATEAQLSTAP